MCAGAIHPQAYAQEVTSVAPQAQGEDLPDSPGMVRFPDAVVVKPKEEENAVYTAHTETVEKGGLVVLDGDVEITYKGYTLKADHAEYNDSTGDAKVSGHVVTTGEENDEVIHASHGEMNVRAQTGKLYDVTGSVGMRPPKPGRMVVTYTNSNPFLFTGSKVVKIGPHEYEIYDGTLTSCQLPKPDWLLSADLFHVDEEKAHAANSIFHLMGLPLLWLPYVTHPVDVEARQSGFLIPTLPWYSSTKGIYVGEQVYWAINRSMDLIAGTTYYSLRGWSENGSFRYRGLGQDFARARFTALQDRGFTPSGGTYTNQGGEEITFTGRHDLGEQTRVVADVDYLSSFLYRQGFTDNFNQAASSDVNSTVYGTREWSGYAASLEGDRYQGEKQIATAVQPEQEVHIFHAPALEFDAVDHALGTTRFVWSMESSAAGLVRTQPGFGTAGLVERLDVHPELAMPLHFGDWNLRPSVGLRETFYSRSLRQPANGSGTPVENNGSINRSDLEATLDLRPPVLERTFDSGLVRRILKHDVKHTIEPEVTYRYVGGISNFGRLLRFDMVDVASDTNEVEYGVTQRLFLKRANNTPCRTANSGADVGEVLGTAIADNGEQPHAGADESDESSGPVCGNREWISWRLAQKYFFDPSFGGAAVDGRRNIFDTTLALSGIAFLTEPRKISPLISRLRVRTTEKMDVEWDFDYDTGAKKFTSNDIFADVHQGTVYGGVSYARLSAPGRSYVEGVSSAEADFSQMRVLLGWGKPSAAGLSVMAKAGVDLNLTTVQYGTVQASYNWNCCGFSVEYLKYELGATRNENAYRFNFTLANIGTAGNLKRTQQIF